MGRSNKIRKMTMLEKELAEKDKLSPLLSKAIAMYQAKETSKKRGFTKDSIKSILLTIFGITPPSSCPLSTMPEWLKLIEQCNTSNPGKLVRAGADKANETKPKNADDMSNWLNQQCSKAKVNMMTDQTPFTISLMVLQELCKIVVDIPERIEASNETNCEFEYVNYFFDAFKGVMNKKQDVLFIYELAANTTQMILDKNLNKELLTGKKVNR
jgi:hypothetical protein